MAVQCVMRVHRMGQIRIRIGAVSQQVVHRYGQRLGWRSAIDIRMSKTSTCARARSSTLYPRASNRRPTSRLMRAYPFLRRRKP